jgi:hypothetical protein
MVLNDEECKGLALDTYACYPNTRHMPKSTEKALHELNRLESKRREVIEALARSDPLVVGSLNVVPRTCGKRSCHCATPGDPGHPVSILMRTVAGRRQCQVVRKADLPQVIDLVQEYRDYREALRALKHLETEEKALLRELMSLRDQGYK